MAKQAFPHCNSAARYAREVVNGKRPACRWVRLACKRHLNDLAKEKKRGYRFRYDKAAAERACRFIELLPHTKGKWAAANELIRLEPWQQFLTCVIFGWLRKRDGLRRFRSVFLLIPRKNGKSLLAAAWGLYMLCADGEHGAEVYAGATTERQAWEVFRPARLMALRTKSLQSYFGLEVNASNLNIISNGSRFEPLIGKPGDGASPSCAIHDEYHEHETDAQFDAMATGMGARDQPLQIAITTAGDNIAGPCYQSQSDAQKVLEGVVTNDELFACIYTIDLDDDWTSDLAIKKANPNYGVSVSIDFLKMRLREAKSTPRKQAAFKTKHLNQWVSARNAFFDLEKWMACRKPRLKLDDFKGEPCRLGLDLASKVDVAALELTFRRENGNIVRFGKYFLPEAQLDKPENDHYRTWMAEGWLTITDGEIIDFDEIRDCILEICREHQVLEVAYDPHQATHLITQLMKEEVPCIEVKPTVLNFSEPMKEMDARARAKTIEHNGDPVMTWMVSNVVAKSDAKDNVYPRKETDAKKIDGVVAHLMALARWLADEVEQQSYLENGDLLIL